MGRRRISCRWRPHHVDTCTGLKLRPQNDDDDRRLAECRCVRWHCLHDDMNEIRNNPGSNKHCNCEASTEPLTTATAAMAAAYANHKTRLPRPYCRKSK